MATGYPKINGYLHDKSSCVLSMDKADGGDGGPPVKSWTKLNYKITRTGENKYGAGALPIGQTRGRVEFSASVGFETREEWDDLRARLGSGYGDIMLNWVATWLEGTTESKVAIRATIGEVGVDQAEGSPAIEITLKPISIVEGDEPMIAA